MKQHLKFKLFQIFILCLAFTFSTLFVSAQSKIKSRCKKADVNIGSGYDIASDSGNDYGSNNTLLNSGKKDVVEKPKNYPEGFKPLQIRSKPRATHTESSRRNCIEGKILLRLTFFADGTVGNIKVISGLPAGLNRQAIEAAKKIKFEPQLKNNKPISVTKKIEYGFWLY